MEIEQTLDLTYVKLDEMKKKLDDLEDNLENVNNTFNGESINNIETKTTEIKNNIETLKTNVDLLKTSTETISTNNATIKTNSEELKTAVDSIDGKIDEIKTKVSNINSTTDAVTSTELANKTSRIIGEGDVDLTKIYNKIDNITNSLIQNNNEPFTTDPYKLDQEFTGYTPGQTVFNTTDYVECTKSFVINDEEHNANYYVAYLGIYCEGETFDAKVIIDVETTVTNAKLEISFPNTTIGTGTTYKQQVELSEGRNIKSETIESVNVSTSGNYIVVKIINGNKAKVNSFKIEVTGTNICILTKPHKYKVFCKYDETIISKLEDHNAYTLKLKTDDLNPGTLKSTFSLARENVKDFYEVISTYKHQNEGCFRACYCQGFLTLSGVKCVQVADLPVYKHKRYGGAEVFAMRENADNYKFCFMIYMCYYSNTNVILNSNSSILNNVSDYNTPIKTVDNIANLCFVYDINKKDSYFYPCVIIATFKNCTNYMYLKFPSTLYQLDLGVGRNVTAYHDATDYNIIYVYMKVGDKMVKKTVQMTISTNDSGTEIRSGEIIEQKIIGTYDYYFETQGNKYIVVKDNKLYVYTN